MTSIVHEATARVNAVMSHERVRAFADTIPGWLTSRLPRQPVFNFGFDDFIPDPSSDVVVGRFRAAVYNEPGTPQAGIRFFLVPTTTFGSVPRPVEHELGGLIQQAPSAMTTSADLITLIDSPDDVVVEYILAHLTALRDLVLDRVSPPEPA